MNIVELPKNEPQLLLIVCYVYPAELVINHLCAEFHQNLCCSFCVKEYVTSIQRLAFNILVGNSIEGRITRFTS